MRGNGTPGRGCRVLLEDGHRSAPSAAAATSTGAASDHDTSMAARGWDFRPIGRAGGHGRGTVGHGDRGDRDTRCQFPATGTRHGRHGNGDGGWGRVGTLGLGCRCRRSRPGFGLPDRFRRGGSVRPGLMRHADRGKLDARGHPDGRRGGRAEGEIPLWNGRRRFHLGRRAARSEQEGNGSGCNGVAHMNSGATGEYGQDVGRRQADRRMHDSPISSAEVHSPPPAPIDGEPPARRRPRYSGAGATPRRGCPPSCRRRTAPATSRRPRERSSIRAPG